MTLLNGHYHTSIVNRGYPDDEFVCDQMDGKITTYEHYNTVQRVGFHSFLRTSGAILTGESLEAQIKDGISNRS